MRMGPFLWCNRPIELIRAHMTAPYVALRRQLAPTEGREGVSVWRAYGRSHVLYALAQVLRWKYAENFLSSFLSIAYKTTLSRLDGRVPMQCAMSTTQ